MSKKVKVRLVIPDSEMQTEEMPVLDARTIRLYKLKRGLMTLLQFICIVVIACFLYVYFK